MKIKLSPFAEQDLHDTIEFYNLEVVGLGFDFLDEVSFTFNRIKENSGQFPRVYKKIRKAKTNRFPFNIFFIPDLSHVFIIAVFHTSRNPKIIKGRSKLKK